VYEYPAETELSWKVKKTLVESTVFVVVVPTGVEDPPGAFSMTLSTTNHVKVVAPETPHSSVIPLDSVLVLSVMETACSAGPLFTEITTVLL
jgi:hypothetical protein